MLEKIESEKKKIISLQAVSSLIAKINLRYQTRNLFCQQKKPFLMISQQMIETLIGDADFKF